MSAPLPPLDVIFDVFKEDVPAVVALPDPDASPVSADVVWLPPQRDTAAIGGGAPLDNLPRLALRVDQVPIVPKLTRIEAPPLGGGAARVWIVRAILETDGQRHIVAVAESA